MKFLVDIPEDQLQLGLKFRGYLAGKFWKFGRRKIKDFEINFFDLE